MKENYDVIVVGVGPAGAMAAKAASKAGASVLALDRRKELGAPVRCGEGIGLHWMEELGVKVPPKAVSQEISGSLLIAPDLNKTVKIQTTETKGYVVDRKVFDKELGIEAARAGADVMVKTEVTAVLKEAGKVSGIRANVMGEEREFRAPVVIACDGGESTVARMAGINSVATLYDTDFGVEYEMVNVECQDLIEIFFSKKYSPRGYVWIFPKGKDVANVGVGIGGLEAPNAKHYLDKFIADYQERLGKAQTVAVKGGTIPVGAPMKEIVTDGLMVAGTAAHQVDPIHGGGICLAMEAGKIAGEVAGEAVEAKKFDKAFLSAYYGRWSKRREAKLLKRLALRKALEQLNDDDFQAVFDVLTDDDVDKLLKGNYAPVVAKVLVRRPQLLRALSAIANIR